MHLLWDLQPRLRVGEILCSDVCQTESENVILWVLVLLPPKAAPQALAVGDAGEVCERPSWLLL